MAKKPSLYDELEALGFETVGALCFGTWKGYAVNLRPNNGSYFLDVAVRVDKKDKQLRQNIAKATKENNPSTSWAA